jgi:hypothetical protein
MSQNVKEAKNAVRDPLLQIVTAEQIVKDLHVKAAPVIHDFIKAAGSPGPHKFKLSDETTIVATFRKTGETTNEAGEKIPLYGMKTANLSDDD